MNTKLDDAKSLIEKMRDDWFPVEDDQIWEKWAKLNGSGSDKVLRLLTQPDIRPSIKKRALFILLVPSPELCSIYWREPDKVVGAVCDRKSLANALSNRPDLISYLMDLFAKFIQVFKILGCYRQEQVISTDNSVVLDIRSEIGEEYCSSLYGYNELILELLTVMPFNLGVKLLNYYCLNDILAEYDPGCSMFCSGYKPLEKLLGAEIDERYKRKTYALMTAIVIAEQIGKAAPRAGHENAASCYVRIVKHQFNCPTHSKGLLLEQLFFIINRKLLHHFGHMELLIESVFNLFPDQEQDKRLRYLVVRFAVMEMDSDDYYALKPRHSKLIRSLLEEFSDYDTELAGRLRGMLHEYEVELVVKQTEVRLKPPVAEVREVTEEELLKEMK